jgi:hypothetical protein
MVHDMAWCDRTCCVVEVNKPFGISVKKTSDKGVETFFKMIGNCLRLVPRGKKFVKINAEAPKMGETPQI